MRFPAAWSEIASENSTLKIVIIALSVGVVSLATVTARLALKEPVVIERGGVVRVAERGTDKVSELEIKMFLKEVIPQRFNTVDLPKTAYFDPSQLKARKIEQDELKKKNMRQTLLISSIEIKGDVINIEADRLIAVEKIRSAFIVSFDVAVAQTQRSAENPYGLVLVKALPITTNKLLESK